MAPIPPFSFLLLAFYSCIFAAASPRPRVLGLDFTKKEVPITGGSLNRLRRRAFTVSSTLYNVQSNLLYLINATVGTPSQRFSLQLDTGSSDIWIPWALSTTCTSKQQRCSNGAYNDTESSSFVDIAPDQFQITYVDQTQIAGDYMNETFGIGGASVVKMTMGLAKQSSEPDSSNEFQGIVGVGFDNGEAIFSQTSSETQAGLTYPNIISQLVGQGFIQTKAYSLWLNDRESKTGNILFGGIDYAKFHGDLTILPLQEDISGSISSFTVTLNSFQIIGNQHKAVYTANQTIPVIFDSGTTLTYLPDYIANAIASGVGAVSNVNYGVVVPCNVANTPATFNFQFGDSNGPTIVAEISQFVLPFPSNIPTPKFKNGKTACRWGILPSDGNPNLFGDTFLRSAYVVYNLDGNQIGIASTNFNATSEDVREISAVSSLPGASATAGGVAQQTHTGAIYLTATGILATGTASSSAVEATGTGTFDLGTPTETSPSGSTKKASAGLNAPLPSGIFATAIAGGMVMFFMLWGGCTVFAV